MVSKSLADPTMSTSTGIGTDLHNLRAVDCQMNISRSNKFQEGGSSRILLTNDGDDSWYLETAQTLAGMIIVEM